MIIIIDSAPDEFTGVSSVLAATTKSTEDSIRIHKICKKFQISLSFDDSSGWPNVKLSVAERSYIQWDNYDIRIYSSVNDRDELRELFKGYRK